MTEINAEFCRKKGIVIYKAIKVLALNSCITDLKNLDKFSPKDKSDDEFMDLIDEFQKPFLENVNRLIKRFVTKSAGIMTKEVPVYETLVDNLMKELDCAKNIEILLVTVSSLVGTIREAAFILYLEMRQKSPSEILTEYNNIFKRFEENPDLYEVLTENIIKIYKHNIIHKLTKDDIQNNRFIVMNLNEEKIISDLHATTEASKPIPMKTGLI